MFLLRDRQKLLWLFALVTAIFWFENVTSAADAPPLSVDRKFFGVCAKLGRGEKANAVVVKVKELGVGSVRFNVPWSSIQISKDIFEWGRFDSVLGALSNEDPLKGVDALSILGFGNPTISSNGECNAEDRDTCIPQYADFKDWVGTLLEKLAGDSACDLIPHWEIWNEPNSSDFLSSSARVEDYRKLMEAAIQARNESKCGNVELFGGVTASIDSGFLSRVLPAAGDLVANSLQGISVHAYPTVKTNKLWISEFGANLAPDSTGDEGERRHYFTEQERVQILVKTLVLSFIAGIDRVFWYQMTDDEVTDKKYGLVNANTNGQITDRHAFLAYQKLIKAMVDSTYEGYFQPKGHPKDFYFVFKKQSPDKRPLKIFFWSEDANRFNRKYFNRSIAITDLATFSGAATYVSQESEAGSHNPFLIEATQVNQELLPEFPGYSESELNIVQGKSQIKYSMESSDLLYLAPFNWQKKATQERGFADDLQINSDTDVLFPFRIDERWVWDFEVGTPLQIEVDFEADSTNDTRPSVALVHYKTSGGLHVHNLKKPSVEIQSRDLLAKATYVWALPSQSDGDDWGFYQRWGYNFLLRVRNGAAWRLREVRIKRVPPGNNKK